MLSLLLCLACFFVVYRAARTRRVHGLIAVAGVGYAYGILRANLGQAAAHFLFDAAVAGFYLAWLTRGGDEGAGRSRPLAQWLVLLVAWPAALMLLPFQDPLIQLVGLRGNVFLLPFLLVGGRLQADEPDRLAVGLAALNLAAFAFAGAEYFLGIERFFPYSAVTEIIYRSNDLVGYQAHRIPATFSSAHAFAGTMVVTVPFLIGAWVRPRNDRRVNLLLAGGLFAALLGVFMAAARSHALVLIVVLLVAAFSGRWRGAAKGGLVVILAAVGWLVAGEERLQRFTTLTDTDYVSQRVAGSINRKFVDLAVAYPLGNGLGGGGTSVPYFLQGRLRDPVAMENEYARILLEQGLPGLFLWTAFVAWAFLRPATVRDDPWFLGRRLARVAAAAYFASGLIGVGLLTSVPQTCLLLLSTGWIAVPSAREREEAEEAGGGPDHALAVPEPAP